MSSILNLDNVPNPVADKFLPRDLVVDPNMQRELIPGHLAMLTKDYNPAVVGTLIVSKRVGGALVILDGQHRYRAALVADPDEYLQVLMFKDLTPAQEAEIFIAFNSAAVVDSISKFKLAVVAGHEEAVAVYDIFHKLGIPIASNSHGNGFNVIATAMRISRWKDGLATFERTLDILQNVFPDWAKSRQTQPWQRSLVEGLALVLHVNPQLDNTRMIQQLRNRGEGWIGQMVSAANYQKSVHRGSLTHHAAGIFVAWYNTDLRGGSRSLPEWPSLKRINTKADPGSEEVMLQFARGAKAKKDAGTPESDEGEHDADFIPELDE